MPALKLGQKDSKKIAVFAAIVGLANTLGVIYLTRKIRTEERRADKLNGQLVLLREAERHRTRLPDPGGTQGDERN